MNDDLIKQEQLSALVDGETSSVQMQDVLSYAESDEGQHSWAMYHLIGDVLRDQLFALRRVGFDAFALRADKDPYDALKAFEDYSEVYQASADQPLPLFRRRA